MLGRILDRGRRRARAGSDTMHGRVARWLRPAATDSVVLGAAAHRVGRNSDLVTENALLRQQLIILARSSRRPRITGANRALLLRLASRVRA
jgi:hypothetical protein